MNPCRLELVRRGADAPRLSRWWLGRKDCLPVTLPSDGDLTQMYGATIGRESERFMVVDRQINHVAFLMPTRSSDEERARFVAAIEAAIGLSVSAPV